ASDALAPGVGGAALLLLAQLAYIPNAIIWAVAYTLGPGFAFGTGTVVAPTGSALGAVPVFPMLAALPTGIGSAGARPGGPGWVPVAVLVLPYLAGIFAGVVTVRIAPTPVTEAAALWGFAAGASAGRPGGGIRRRPARQRPSGLGRPVWLPGRPGGDPRARYHRRAIRGRGELADLAARPVQAPRGQSGRPATTPGPAPAPGPAGRDRRRRRAPDLRQPLGRRRVTRHRPVCSTLSSLPTDLVNWSWHACCAVTVFAAPMQL